MSDENGDRSASKLTWTLLAVVFSLAASGVPALIILGRDVAALEERVAGLDREVTTFRAQGTRFTGEQALELERRLTADIRAAERECRSLHER